MDHSPDEMVAPASSTGSVLQHPQRHDNILLQVGHQRFNIEAAVLCESARLFEALIFGSTSAAMRAPARTSDGAFIVQANPEIFFKHIMDFCLFSSYPLFWEQGGFQYGQYAQLLNQARYFQVNKLVAWIEAKKFEKFIKRTFDHCSWDALDHKSDTLYGSTDRSLQYILTKQRVWNCARGLAVHVGPHMRGAADRCGKDCAKAGDGYWSEAEANKAVVVSQTTKVDWESLICCD